MVHSSSSIVALGFGQANLCKYGKLDRRSPVDKKQFDPDSIFSTPPGRACKIPASFSSDPGCTLFSVFHRHVVEIIERSKFSMAQPTAAGAENSAHLYKLILNPSQSRPEPSPVSPMRFNNHLIHCHPTPPLNTQISLHQCQGRHGRNRSSEDQPGHL
jgi:hypothetical protein